MAHGALSPSPFVLTRIKVVPEGKRLTGRPHSQQPELKATQDSNTGFFPFIRIKRLEQNAPSVQAAMK